MEIEFVMLADAAQVVQGKLYALGGAWNVRRCGTFPETVPFSIVLSILVPRAEAGRRHAFTLTVKGSDGEAILPPMTGQFELGLTDADDGSRGVFAINVALPLPRPDRYTVVATAGGAEKSISFDAGLLGNRIEMHSGS